MKPVLATIAVCTALLFTGCDAISSNGADASADAPVAYAHESNNSAQLSGDGVTGSAIVNYAKGSPTEWRSTATVRGLDAGTYTFAVSLNGNNLTDVCTFTTNGRGSAGCSADTEVPGFNTAVILDGDDIVASGTFARRGGMRAENEPGGQPFSADLTGEAEVPGPGDPDGSGTFTATINRGQGLFCYELAVSDIAPARAAHLHEAPAGDAGPVVIPLTPPTGGSSSGCIDIGAELATEIAMDPSDYYVNVHNADFPPGAVRGQLSR